ncbi:PLD nuclease N-terminal domain-containing protein [Streptomyces sp. NPDC047841]|uniref:PLD nuclease N-terminal domain-containing protein n=1 Tax=Streptomyces sp. NPDC047841 TaxID=3154708 RepID=UPI003455147D
MNALSVHQMSVAAGNGQVGSWLAGAVVIIALLAYVALVVGALISIATSGVTGGMKVMWFVFVVVAPFIGSLLWFLVGRRDSCRQKAVV